MSQAWKRDLKETTRFRAFIIIGDSDVVTSRCADESWWFECTCAMVFLLENGADDHDITMCCHEDLSC